MREKVVRFGKSAVLSGVMTDPATADPSRPAVLMLNPGILHRVGACRFHVHAARALAGAGATVLRFDYSGIGDSDSRKDSLSFEEAAVQETREAMDYLATTRGVSRFVLLGLCSGADMAHLVARSEPRVAGLAMLDAWAYRTPKYYLRRVAPKLLSPSAWAHSIKVRLPGGDTGPKMLVDSEDVKAEVPRYVRVFPPRDQIERDLHDFMRRGVELWFAFSASADFNYATQYQDAFSSVDFGDRLTVEYLPDANHIFTGLAHQQHLFESVVRWYGQRFAAGAPVTAGA